MSKKERHTIDLDKIEGFNGEDLIQLYQEGSNKLNLIIVDQYPTNFDSEKGYQDSRVIFKHKDNYVFYEGELSNWGCGECEYETILTEVFPREITKIIYE